jgi:outer membrane receptor for ferrienterochelin and colicins
MKPVFTKSSYSFCLFGLILNKALTIQVKLLQHFLLGSIFFAVSSSNADAFQSDLSGKVISETGGVIADAHIYLSETKWAVSNLNGDFFIESIPNGEYTIKVSRIGYLEKSISVNIGSDTDQQITIRLKEKVYEDSPVVVTASRTRKELEDVSVPITVIEQQEIAMSGNLRLSDVLEEQVGLNLVSDHGTGIQVQGFDPDYTLILIDNQPVIGRTAGTLDLTRLAVGDIKQIEMVKGPSSALWGSDALAGVINIITEKGSRPLNWDVTGRYGTHNTYDASSNLTFKKNNLNGKMFLNTNSSDGYDLNSDSFAPTTPEYQNYTFSTGLGYRFNQHLTLRLNSRYYREDQNYMDMVTQSGSSQQINGSEFQEDYSISPEALVSFGDNQLIEANAFLSRFRSSSNAYFNESGDIYFEDAFDQSLNKFEIKSSSFWTEDHTSVFGLGMNREDLKADIYADIPYFDSYFAFGQHEWKLNDDLSLTGGFRFDAHSEYDSQLSPKFSGLYKPNDVIHFRASLGGGFKAPDFRQLFLNFTNPIAGYSVYGTSTVQEGIEMLQESGQIKELYYDPSEFDEIKAEHSFAYNVGIDLFPEDGMQFRLNLFRNDVQDLIETQRIALKTNDQSVFSYFNLNKIYTQGAEFEFRYEPYFINGLRVALGYQFLDAQRQITRTFDDVVDGKVVSVTKNEYIPMYNRSRHSGNLKFFYILNRIGLEASLRLQYRGRYWFSDSNNNLRADENEYALNTSTLSGMWDKTIINASVAKTFYDRFRLQVGMNNINDYTNEAFLPSNPGMTFYTQLNINIY